MHTPECDLILVCVAKEASMKVVTLGGRLHPSRRVRLLVLAAYPMYLASFRSSSSVGARTRLRRKDSPVSRSGLPRPAT
jgi:hypothetical protein